jgi:hypothetical protein
MIIGMRGLLTGICAAWLLAGLVCALPAAAVGAQPETERWVPALAVFGEVLAQQAEQTRESAADLSASSDDLRVLALVDSTDGLVTLLVPKDEKGHWVAEIAVPAEAPLQQAGRAEPGAILPDASSEAVVASPVVIAAAEPGAIPPGPSGEAVVASPVVIATAEPESPAATSAPDEVVEPIPPVEAGETGSAPEAAVPEPKAKDEAERWVPAFSIYTGVLVQDAEASIDTGPITGECVPPRLSYDTLHCERQIRPTALVDIGRFDPVPPADEFFVTTKGDDLMVTPFVAGSLELMTPGLTSVPGRPRLFVHGDAAVSFAFTRDVAKEGIPEAFEVSPNVNNPNEATILGQGSALTAEVKPLLLSAGAGVAFTIDAWERRLRIKPSVEYLREEIEVTGVVHRAVQTRLGTPGDPDDPIPTTAEFPDGFRLIQLSGSDKRFFHGVGPGLEVELDAGRAGPLVLAVYVAGQAYAFLGDLEMEFSDANEVGGTEPETATWRFEKNRWGFRSGVGLRFRWVPE